MIVIRVYGGLGNQLFQYAFGIFLQEKFNQKIYFDFSFYNSNTHRAPSILKIINNLNQSPESLSNSFVKFNSFRVNRLYNRIFNKNYYSNYSDGFLPNPNENYFFDGYWQDKKYLKNELINLKMPSLSINADYYFNQIKKSKSSLSIHIRRTDYLTKKNQKIFKILDEKYYESSLKLIKNLGVSNSELFVFSDDHKWVNENLKLNQKFTVIENTNEIEDLFLMATCNHNIIANSTFSWWGAFLNSNKNKIVVGPKVWYKNDYSENDIKLKGWNWI